MQHTVGNGMWQTTLNLREDHSVTATHTIDTSYNNNNAATVPSKC